MLSRRQALRTTALGVASVAASSLAAPALVFGADDGPFPQAPLGYDVDALAPVISGQTVALHYGKHHAGYHRALNRLVADTPYEGMSLPAVLRAAVNNPAATAIFNNAGQAWNHTLYWAQMAPGGARAPSGTLAEAIAQSFGGFEAFKDQFVRAAGTLFGSGWVWLVADRAGLGIVTTRNGANPAAYGAHAVIGVDVWEHAYYLDYQNRRGEHVRALLDQLIDWHAAGDRLAAL